MFTTRIANRMSQRGILMNKLVIHYNTLKIRPPMPFSIADADQRLHTLDAVLTDLGPAHD
jgi:4-aminobutyrate aminotransferase-like enzyme